MANCRVFTRCACNDCIYPSETQTRTGIKYLLCSQNPNKEPMSDRRPKTQSSHFFIPWETTNLMTYFDSTLGRRRKWMRAQTGTLQGNDENNKKREGWRRCLIVCCDVEGINRGSTEATKSRQLKRVLECGSAGATQEYILKVHNVK